MGILDLFSQNKNRSSFGSSLGSFIMDMLPFGNLIDSGIGLISGISNNIYDRQLQKTIFERDDTQLTRLMKEYQRNGLNPLLGLPGASVGNTKGFEPSPIQTNFANSNAQRLQLKSLELQNKNIEYQNKLAKAELQEKQWTNALEREILRGKVNAQSTVKTNFYKGYNLPYSDSGVEYIPQSEKEKLIRILFNGDVPQPKVIQTADTKNQEYDTAVKTMDDYVKEGKLIKSKVGNTFYIPDSEWRINYSYLTGKYEVSDGWTIFSVKGRYDTLEQAYQEALKYSTKK